MGIALPRWGSDHSIEWQEGFALPGLASDSPVGLDALLQRYWLPVVTYVESVIHDPDAAEDIAQEAFLYLWEGKQRWKAGDSVRALLYRVARSRALNHVRHDRMRARTGPLIEASRSNRRWNPTPLQILEQVELRAALKEAIEALPPRRREVFILGYLNGCRHAEVAQIMGISEHTARNHMSAALADLRRMLQPFLE